VRTPLVHPDPGSNARWTVDAMLRRLDLQAATALIECPTPSRARQEALARNAPLLVSRHVLVEEFFVEIEVERLEFRRAYELVLPAVGEPSSAVKALIRRLEAAVASW
jgi:hypothetical protein